MAAGAMKAAAKLALPKKEPGYPGWTEAVPREKMPMRGSMWSRWIIPYKDATNVQAAATAARDESQRSRRTVAEAADARPAPMQPARNAVPFCHSKVLRASNPDTSAAAASRRDAETKMTRDRDRAWHQVRIARAGTSRPAACAATAHLTVENGTWRERENPIAAVARSARRKTEVTPAAIATGSPADGRGWTFRVMEPRLAAHGVGSQVRK